MKFQRLVSLSAIALILVSLAENVRPQQASQRQQQQQQQASEQQQSLNQAPYVGDYASLVAENLVNLGQPVFNNKRARKMSAFMPMRGRKDGRDGQRLFGEESQEAPDFAQFLVAQGVDDADANIMRLVGPTLDGAGLSGHWFAAAAGAPRQFANQLAERHMLVAPREESVSLAEGVPVMQAKLRRAFHPMRGKKSEGPRFASYLSTPEVIFPDDMQTD